MWDGVGEISNGLTEAISGALESSRGASGKRWLLHKIRATSRIYQWNQNRSPMVHQRTYGEVEAMLYNTAIPFSLCEVQSVISLVLVVYVPPYMSIGLTSITVMCSECYCSTTNLAYNRNCTILECLVGKFVDV